jgi:nitrate/nitrite transporter NarK
MARHLSLKSMSLATVPWLLEFIGYGLSGVLSDLIFCRTGNALCARKWVLIVFLGTAGVCVTLAGAVTTTVSALLLLTAIVVFALYLSGSTYRALIQDTIPGPRLGSFGGCVQAIANCARIVRPAATGFLVEQSHTFFSAFVLADGIALASVLAVAILLRPRSSTKLKSSNARVCG